MRVSLGLVVLVFIVCVLARPIGAQPSPCATAALHYKIAEDFFVHADAYSNEGDEDTATVAYKNGYHEADVADSVGQYAQCDGRTLMQIFVAQAHEWALRLRYGYADKQTAKFATDETNSERATILARKWDGKFPDLWRQFQGHYTQAHYLAKHGTFRDVPH